MAAPVARPTRRRSRRTGRRPRWFLTSFRDSSRRFVCPQVGRTAAFYPRGRRERARAADGGPSWQHGRGMIAYAGGIPPPFSPVRLLTGWSLSAPPLVLVVATGVLYALGLRRLSSGPR